ncbi:MAG: lamin tail domain-containing protein [Deltaproteobacteria bacterium]|nr:lamin tail domain-containing protein [Deltaproteobacteria bacterium]
MRHALKTLTIAAASLALLLAVCCSSDTSEPDCSGVTECIDGDGCCPTGCTHADDDDCADPCEGVTECIDGDGCCPSGCTEADDDDCGGDPCEGVTECLDGDGCCPTGCTFADDDDCEDPCEGVTQCLDGDGCCPTGCTFADDDDCENPCEGVTQCINGDGCCPTGCTFADDDDCDPCAGVTECINDDGCCPQGCTFANDNDCVDPCAGVTDCINDDGCCPLGCTIADDNDCEDPCMGVTQCINDDGCCPQGCTFADDNDCEDPCANVTECINDDGCCPQGCTQATDNDCCDSMETLRGAAAGAVDLQLCPARVTYAYAQGYFLQASATGPAVMVYEGADWTADVAVGDQVRMHVTELTDYNGLLEITAHDAVEVLSQGNPVDPWVQDLSGGTLPVENLESELVLVTGATITAVDGRDLTISYGTATDVLLHTNATSALGYCAGATLDFRGPVGEYSGVYQLRSYDDSDFANFDDSNCESHGRAPVAGDLVLNEFLADPPRQAAGDANCDGSRNGTEDEFLEIANVSGDDLDLSGVTVYDDLNNNGRIRYTFQDFGLPAGGVVVLYGGGEASCAYPGNVITLVSGGLSLNNAGDVISIDDASGTSLLTYTYGGEGGNASSLTLSPDLDTTDGYELHTTADTADNSPFSPGTAIDGSPLSP